MTDSMTDGMSPTLRERRAPAEVSSPTLRERRAPAEVSSPTLRERQPAADMSPMLRERRPRERLGSLPSHIDIESPIKRLSCSMLRRRSGERQDTKPKTAQDILVDAIRQHPLPLALLGVAAISTSCDAILCRLVGKGCLLLIPYALGYGTQCTLLTAGVLLCACRLWFGVAFAIDVYEVLMCSGLGLLGAGAYIQTTNLTRLRPEDLEVVRHRGEVPLSTRFCVIAARTALDSLYLWTSSRRRDFIKAVNDATVLEDSLKAKPSSTLDECQRAQFVAFLSTVVQAHRRQWADGRSNPVGIFMEQQMTMAQNAVKDQVKGTWLQWRSSVVSSGSKYCSRLPEYVEPRSARKLASLLALHWWASKYHDSTEVRVFQVIFPLLAAWRYVMNRVNSCNFDRRTLRRVLHFCRLNYVCYLTDSIVPGLQPMSWRELARHISGFALYIMLQKRRWHDLLPNVLRQSAILNTVLRIYVPSYLSCRWLLNVASVQNVEWLQSPRSPRTLLDHSRFSAPMKDPVASTASLPIRRKS